MERYEQIMFIIEPNVSQKRMSVERCYDCDRQEIKVGDYVVATCGDALREGIEGFVTEIYFYEESGPEIRISTYGGKVLKEREDPQCYRLRS